jgi:hypothetical protein
MKKYLTTLLMLISSNLFAQDYGEFLPEFYGNGHAGTEFFLTFTPAMYSGNKYPIHLFVFSTVKTSVKVSVPENGFYYKRETVPNGVIIFNLAIIKGQMYNLGNGAGPVPPEPSGVYEKRAIIIESNDPVVVYAVSRQDYSGEGFLVLPANLLGTNYIVSSWADPTTNVDMFSPSYTSIVAVSDSTEVEFILKGSNESKVMLEDDTLRYGEKLNFMMNKGDVALIAGIGKNNDLTGSVINASKPVAVVSGNFCSYIPTDVSNCNPTMEMELPTERWGYEYFVTPIIEREKSSIVKIFALEDDTDIFKDGEFFKNLPNAKKGVNGVSYLEIRADEEENRPVVYSSDKPIHVVQYNTGSVSNESYNDPFQMNLLTSQNFSEKIVFSTPGIKDYGEFNENYINLVYLSDVNGNFPDSLMLASYSDNEWSWKKLKEMHGDPGLEFANRDEKTGRKWMSKTIRLNSRSVYQIKNNEKFCVYSYGFDSGASYGYPAGGIFLIDSSIKFEDSSPPNYSITKTEDIQRINFLDNSNEGKSSGLSIIQIYNKTNFECGEPSFVSGLDSMARVEYEIPNKHFTSSATIYISDKAGNDTTYNLLFKPDPTGELILDNYNIEIIDNIYYMKKTLEIGVINRDNKLSGFIHEIKITGDIDNVAVDYLSNLPIEVKPNEKWPLLIYYNPVKPQKSEFQMSIVYNDKEEHRVNILLESLESRIEIDNIDFDKVPEKVAKTMELLIQNTGKCLINIFDLKLDNNYNFSFYQKPEVPFSINPGESKIIKMMFHPQKLGLIIGTLTVESDAHRGDSEVFLYGNGVVSSTVFEEKPLINIINTDNYLILTLPQNTTSRGLTISDMAGRPVYSTKEVIQPGRTEIELGELSTGAYFVEFLIDGEKVTAKFVK